MKLSTLSIERHMTHNWEMNHFWEEVAHGVGSKGGQAITRQIEHHEKSTQWWQGKQHWLRPSDGGKEPGAFKIWKNCGVMRARRQGEHGESSWRGRQGPVRAGHYRPQCELSFFTPGNTGSHLSAVHRGMIWSDLYFQRTVPVSLRSQSGLETCILKLL